MRASSANGPRSNKRCKKVRSCNNKRQRASLGLQARSLAFRLLTPIARPRGWRMGSGRAGHFTSCPCPSEHRPAHKEARRSYRHAADWLFGAEPPVSSSLDVVGWYDTADIELAHLRIPKPQTCVHNARIHIHTRAYSYLSHSHVCRRRISSLALFKISRSLSVRPAIPTRAIFSKIASICASRCSSVARRPATRIGCSGSGS